MTSSPPRRNRPAPEQRPAPFNPARELAVRVLMKVMGSDGFAAPNLDAALQQAELPARDAGLATHIVYGTLRHQPSLAAALSPLLNGETHPKVQTLLLAGAFEKLILGTPAHAVANEYVNLARTARLAPPGLVNAVLRRVEPVAQAGSELPEWLEGVYRWAYGAQADAVMADLLEPQPMWLSLSEQGVRLLKEEGSALTATLEGVDRVELSRPLRDTAAYRTGHAQPINPASMACVDALGDVDGARVLDLAGGAGIKAAMLATRGAQVTSVDNVARKHQAAEWNLARLRLKADFITHDLTLPLNAESLNAESLNTEPLHAGPLDVPPAPFVLLDAPCTGSGTLRSHPEIKLRLTPAVVAEMAALQARLLPNAAALVGPGGVLVYSVCSVTPQEGPEVVNAFLAAHPEFVPEPVPDLEVAHLQVGAGLLTLPLGGVDGFFIARMRRRK